MRIVWLLCALAVLGLFSGCSSRQDANSARGPLFTGKLEDGTFWQKPLTSPTNEGGGYDRGSRVEIYDQFIAVTTLDGFTHIHPHGYYSGLRIKKD